MQHPTTQSTYRARVIGVYTDGKLSTTRFDPGFLRRGIEWCLSNIGNHGNDWYVEEHFGTGTIALTTEEDVTCFKLAFPEAYIEYRPMYALFNIR